MKRFNMLYILLISLVSAMGGLCLLRLVVIGGAKIFYGSLRLEGLPASALGHELRPVALSGREPCLPGCGATDTAAKMLLLASVLFTISAIGVGMANGFTGFIIYRIIGGFGIGIASNIFAHSLPK